VTVSRPGLAPWTSSAAVGRSGRSSARSPPPARARRGRRRWSAKPGSARARRSMLHPSRLAAIGPELGAVLPAAGAGAAPLDRDAALALLSPDPPRGRSTARARVPRGRGTGAGRVPRLRRAARSWCGPRCARRPASHPMASSHFSARTAAFCELTARRRRSISTPRACRSAGGRTRPLRRGRMPRSGSS